VETGKATKSVDRVATARAADSIKSSMEQRHDPQQLLHHRHGQFIAMRLAG